MIPRYSPALALGSLVTARLTRTAAAGSAREELAHALSLCGDAEVQVFASARCALHAWFDALARRTPRRTVLVSAQICPVVPTLLRHCGFRPWFVDLDDAHPGPGPAQFALAAADPRVAGDHAATLVAPFYGYLPMGMETLELGSGAELVLDLAQGFGFGERLTPLAQRAAAMVYSFGLGKGIDTGGGLLACPPALAPHSNHDNASLGLPDLRTLTQAAVLIGADRLGLYRLLLSFIEHGTAEGGRFDGDSATVPTGQPLSGKLAHIWRNGAKRLLEEVELARVRAAELCTLPAVSAACRNGEIYGSTSHAHLRQVLRLKDASRRTAVLARLRDAGIDALPAGEPLPDSYLPEAPAGHAFPNAAAFRSDAIRLPFLGRLSDAAFARLKQSVERSVADHL